MWEWSRKAGVQFPLSETCFCAFWTSFCHFLSFHLVFVGWALRILLLLYLIELPRKSIVKASKAQWGLTQMLLRTHDIIMGSLREHSRCVVSRHIKFWFISLFSSIQQHIHSAPRWPSQSPPRQGQSQAQHVYFRRRPHFAVLQQ